MTDARLTHGQIAPAQRRRCAGSAFTLVEMLIVVAVLAAILTLSIPSFRKLAIKGELRNAARQVRVTLLETRLDAIESGGLTFFHYQPGGLLFEAGRGTGLADGESASGTAQEAAGLDQSSADTSASDEAPEPQSLPHGVWFPDATEAATAPLGVEEEQVETDSWSKPLVFYPNGRTRNARIELATEAYRIEVVVRGLTGTVQISEVQRRAVEEGEPAATSGETLP